MKGATLTCSIVLVFAFASILPVLKANIAKDDEVWRRRAAESWDRTLKSYDPNPEKIVSHLNMHVHR